MTWECSECGALAVRARRPIHCDECGTAGIIFVAAEARNEHELEGEDLRDSWLHAGFTHAPVRAVG